MVHNLHSYCLEVNDQIDKITFHIPHDWYENMDELYIHPHWGHNGTAISGNFVIDWYLSFSKGYSQEEYPAATILRQTIPTSTVSQPQYYHNVNDFVIANQGGTGGKLDLADFEVDGILHVAAKVIQIPTITGGDDTEPFIFTVDLHYQTTNVGTKERNAPFI